MTMTSAAEPAETAPAESLIETIERLALQAEPEGMTLRELSATLGERAFGAVLFALALPCCIPFLYVVPQIVAVPMAVFAGQMAIGRGQPWLPARLADRRIDRDGLVRMAQGGRRFFGWAETLARPRLLALSSPVAERVVGVFLTLFCVSILTPIPGTNTVPGFAVALVALGLLERDGLLILAGLVIGTAWIGLLVFGAVFLGTQGVSAVFDWVQASLAGG